MTGNIFLLISASLLTFSYQSFGRMICLIDSPCSVGTDALCSKCAQTHFNRMFANADDRAKEYLGLKRVLMH